MKPHDSPQDPIRKGPLYDVIIVGGGPAGLTAAVYCIHKRLEMLLIAEELGGKTNYHLQLPFLEGYEVIRGVELIDRFKSQLAHLKLFYTLDSVDQIEQQEDAFLVHRRLDVPCRTRTVIVATGARPQLLGVPGEDKYLMRGVSYSATSYAPLLIDRKAAVVGGGELALRSAMELANHARHVFLVCQSPGQLDVPAGRWLREAGNVTVLEDFNVSEIRGDEFVRSILLERGGVKKEVAVHAVFVEKRLIPNSGFVDGLVDMDEDERIVIDSQNRTSCPGVFAAGDVSNTYREQVLVAVGEGAKAALSVYEYLMTLDDRAPARAGQRLPEEPTAPSLA